MWYSSTAVVLGVVSMILVILHIRTLRVLNDVVKSRRLIKMDYQVALDQRDHWKKMYLRELDR